MLGLAKLVRRAQQDSWDVQTTSPTGHRTRSLAPLLVVQDGVFPEMCPPVPFYMCGLQKTAPRSLFHKWERMGAVHLWALGNLLEENVSTRYRKWEK